MQYKIAIFDMDGTILNTLDDLADCMNYCLRVHQMPERTLTEVRHFVGNGIHKLVERAVPAGSDETTIEKVFTTFHSYYKDHCAIKTRPYDGIPKVLSSLREQGVITAVVSNKADYAVKSLCADYFDGLFDFSAGDRPDRRIKPYPDMVNDVLKQFRLSPSDAVYIGDSEVDLQTAENAEMDSIIVGWGFRTEEELRSFGAVRVIHKPEQITSIIMQ